MTRPIAQFPIPLDDIEYSLKVLALQREDVLPKIFEKYGRLRGNDDTRAFLEEYGNYVSNLENRFYEYMKIIYTIRSLYDRNKAAFPSHFSNFFDEAFLQLGSETEISEDSNNKSSHFIKKIYEEHRRCINMAHDLTHYQNMWMYSKYRIHQELIEYLESKLAELEKKC